MPKPKKGEKKSSYISRAVEYMMRVEKMDQKAALGKAYGMWRSYRGKK